MNSMAGGKRPMLVALVLAGTAIPAAAQDTMAESRLRRIEAEVRALQRQVFPGDGKVFSPQNTPAQAASPVTGMPATTAVTDLLGRMDAVEGQLARLTAQSEENANKLRQIEARLPAPVIAPDPAAAAAAVPGAATTTPPAASANLSAMTGGASAPKPVAPAAAAATAPAAPAPVSAAPAPVQLVPPAAAKPVVAAPAARPAAAAPVAAPSAQRLAAVRAIAKPQSDDAGEDDYSYGFRLWEAKFYPEAQQQLRMFVDKYPRHARLSYARNLLGRAYLEDGKPRDAAVWFLRNYQTNKTGERAADSLLFLAESMGRLKDTNRACIALAEFTDTYPREAAARLKAQYDATRAAVKCN